MGLGLAAWGHVLEHGPDDIDWILIFCYLGG